MIGLTGCRWVIGVIVMRDGRTADLLLAVCAFHFEIRRITWHGTSHHGTTAGPLLHNLRHDFREKLLYD